MISSTRTLLIVTALLEGCTGSALLIVPSMVAELLLGEGLSSPQARVVARIASVALISVGSRADRTAIDNRRAGSASARRIVKFSGRRRSWPANLYRTRRIEEYSCCLLNLDPFLRDW
jgi:hypothetical protein